MRVQRRHVFGCCGGSCALTVSLLAGGIVGAGLVLAGLTQAQLPTLAATLTSVTPPPTTPAGSATATPPPARKALLLHLIDGSPATGVQVQIRTPDHAAQQAITDATGQAVFANLGSDLWTVTFTGTVGGRSIQPAAAQGQPPYGANPAGGGFGVLLEPQSEDAAPTPVVRNGQVQAEVQVSRFALLPLPDNTWAVTWDLAGTDTPLPVRTGASGVTSTATPVLTATPAAAPASVAPLLPGAEWGGWLLGAAVGFITGYTVWDLRRQERAARRLRAAAPVPAALPATEEPSA